MTERHESLSGVAAARRLLEEAKKEEFVAIELVARALRSSRRRVLRDWHTRGLPVTRVGHRKLLASRLVLSAYFPHADSPVISDPIAPNDAP
jgi:hypothetical protein